MCVPCATAPVSHGDAQGPLPTGIRRISVVHTDSGPWCTSTPMGTLLLDRPQTLTSTRNTSRLRVHSHLTCSVVHDLRKAASPPGYSREDSLTSQEGEVHPWSSAVHRVSSRNEDPRTTSPRKARQWPPPPLPRSPPRFLTERGYGKQLHHHGRYMDGKTDGPQSTASFTERTGRCSRRRPTSRRTRPTRSSYQALHRTQEVTDRARHDHGHLRWSLASFLFLLLGLLGCLFPEQLIDHRNRVRLHPTGAPRPLHRSGART